MSNPVVSVIIPCYNEEKTITRLLEALHAQSYPCSSLEVIIADGRSTDTTLAKIDQFRAAHPDLKLEVLVNEGRTIPQALNRAIQAASGEIIIRMDAHSIPHPDYVQLSVAALRSGQGDNVGGVWHIQPGADTWVARSIAAAAGHPFGVGDAKYRHSDTAAYVDTVPFGAFYRSLIMEVGGFDETLLANEDYEFNTRLRESGKRIWLDPAIIARYYARPTLLALARQYWRYGSWKAVMLRRYPRSLRFRQALPPLFVLSLFILPLLGVALPLLKSLFWLEMVIYGLVLFVAGFQTARNQQDYALLLGVPLAIATMHIAWGAAFLKALLFPPTTSS